MKRMKGGDLFELKLFFATLTFQSRKYALILFTDYTNVFFNKITCSTVIIMTFKNGLQSKSANSSSTQLDVLNPQCREL